jgi:cell division septal protein FtsQ
MKINRKQLVSVGVLTLFAAAVYLFAWSSIFSVQSVSISGVPKGPTTTTVSSKVGVSVGMKLARVDSRQISRRLEGFKWIEKVEVSRNWISRKVAVEILPRTPIALFNPISTFGSSIDRFGVIFSLPGGAPNSLPRVEAPSSESGLEAIRLFTSLPVAFRESITLMNASKTGTYRINYGFKSRVIAITWGDSKDTDLKVEVVEKLLTLKENGRIRYIDVSAPHAPVVR